MNPFEITEGSTKPSQTVDKPTDGSKMPARRSGRKKSEGKSGKYRAKNSEMFSREIKVNENSSIKIYSRDEDNLYPLRMEKAIINSPTGRRCADMMAKFIQGKGNKVNYSVGNGLYINDIIGDSARDLAYQGGVFYKLKYKVNPTNQVGDNIVFDPILETLDYILTAVSKEDDDGRKGRFYVLKTNDDGTVKMNDEDVTEWYYPFSRNSDIILYQMYNDCRLKGIENPTIDQLVSNYRGQVNYLNTTPRYKYALGLADSVYNDMDTEARIAIYNNVQTRKGFLGKTVVKMFDNGEEDNEEFVEEVKAFLGAENSGSALVVEVPADIDGKLEDAFVIDQLKPQFDDKLFEKTILYLRQNIMGAFNNIPEPLVFSSTGALFGTNAETYREMKLFYWEQNDIMRSKLEQELARMGFPVIIESLIEEEEIKTDNNE